MMLAKNAVIADSAAAILRSGRAYQEDYSMAYVDGCLIILPAKVVKDPRLQAFTDPKWTPFDMKRMPGGGFKVIVDIQPAR